MTTSPDWRDQFCGREQELEHLLQAFRAVAAGRGPRLVVVLGDRGMGKTRLIQEFYRRLSTEFDPEDYWPDARLFQGNNLRVAPDLTDPETQAHFASFSPGQRTMPFLWWGFRLTDPGDRNAARADMAAHRRTLDPHLHAVLFARRLAAIAGELKKVGVDVGKSAALKAVEAIPVAGWILSLALEATEKGKQAADAWRARRQAEAEQAAADVASLSQRHDADIQKRTLEDLAAICEPKPEMAQIPVVVFCDDAQFARTGGDEGTLRFLSELWQRAQIARWPLLLVATHWALDWYRGIIPAGDARFATYFSLITDDPDIGEAVELPREPALRSLVQSGLPAFGDDDATQLLDKADGNPQVLIELIGLVRRSPAWHAADGGLSPHGRRQVAAHTTDLARLIFDRLQSDSTPESVRRAIALASVQGMRFLCTLTEAASQALALGSALPALNEAEKAHRLVVGTDEGLASFVQRAYREAANRLVDAHIGDPATVNDALLGAALGFIDNDERWNALSIDEQRATLGVLIGLGEDSADEYTRLRTAGALVALARDAMSDGVRDFALAAELARRLVAGLGRRWEVSDFRLAELDDIHRAIVTWHGEREGASLLDQMLQVARSAVGSERSIDTLQPLMVMLGRAADQATAMGEPARALEYLREGGELAREIEAAEPSEQARRDLAAMLYSQSAAVEDEAEAEALARESLDLFRALNDASPSAERQRELARAHRRLGQTLWARGHVDEAAAAYWAAGEIFHALSEQKRAGELVDWEGFADAMSDLADVAVAQSDWQKAFGLYKTSLEYHRALAETQPTPDRSKAVAQALERQVRLHLRFGQGESAEPLAREAVDIRRAVAVAYGTWDTAASLAGTLRLLGHALMLAERPSEALVPLEESAASLRRSRDGAERGHLCVDLAESCLLAGKVAGMLGQWSAAIGWLEEGESAMRDNDALSVDARPHLLTCDLLTSLAEAHQHAGNEDSVRRLHKLYLDAARSFVAIDNLPGARHHLCLALNLVGEDQQAAGALADAQASFDASLDMLRALQADAERLAPRDVERDLIVGLVRSGDLARSMGDWMRAERCLADAAMLTRSRVERMESVEALADALGVFMRWGDVARAQNAREVASSRYREALPLGKRLVEADASARTLEELGRLLTRISVVEWNTAAPPSLQALLREAHACFTEAASHEGWTEPQDMVHVRNMLAALDNPDA